jgi:transglutaminase-like putative cysteine protease
MTSVSVRRMTSASMQRMTSASMRAGLVLTLSCVLIRPACGQDPVAAAIPDSLRQGASVVERVNETEIDIESPHKARIRRRAVYTILNANGDTYATFHTYYDKFHDLVNATGILYDAGGRELKKIRKSDMEDWSTAGSGILMTDSRVKLYHFSCRSYPYSVSYAEEVEQSGLFVLPEWRPQPSPSMAVESSRLTVRTPAGFSLRYREYGVVKEEKDGGTVYTWEMQARPAVRQEPFAPSWSKVEPAVLLASGEFEEGGYKGRLDSWADMGKFVEELYRGRDQLPEEAKRKVHALISGTTDDREKIDTLYDWLQQDTHYVAIELGIGGWQPFDVKDVYARKYGDCKALSNYMVALLKEAGIRAGNVLIRSGDHAPAMDTGFVCSQFNHAIVVAFAGNDSVWLECTNPYLPAGYLSSFTADRDALLLDESGGHIVHTPVYGVNENRLIRVLQGSIDSGGNLQAGLRISYSGLEQDAPASEMDHLSKKEWREQQEQSLGLSNCTIDDLGYQRTRDNVPVIEENMKLTAMGYSTVAGNRLFLRPGIFLKRADRINESGPRREGVELTTSVEEMDSVILRIPAGYVPEGALPSAGYSASFGSYRIRGEMRGDTLVLICRFRQNKGIYPADSWPKLEHFFNLIHREGDRELVFIRAVKPT